MKQTKKLTRNERRALDSYGYTPKNFRRVRREGHWLTAISNLSGDTVKVWVP